MGELKILETSQAMKGEGGGSTGDKNIGVAGCRGRARDDTVAVMGAQRIRYERSTS